MWNKIKRWIKGFKRKQEERNRTACQMIGAFYLSIYSNGNYQSPYVKATEDITQLGITKVVWSGHTIHITLSRPGLLIGRRGENINELQKWLSKMTESTITVDIIEDSIISWLIPYDPKEYDDF